MAVITDLPNELLEEIVQHLDEETLLDIRAACTRLQSCTEVAVGEAYFKRRTVFINIRQSLEALDAISQNARFAHHIKTLILSDQHLLKNCQQITDRQIEKASEDYSDYIESLDWGRYFTYWTEQQYMINAGTAYSMLTTIMRRLSSFNGLAYERYEHHPLMHRIVRELYAAGPIDDTEEMRIARADALLPLNFFGSCHNDESARTTLGLFAHAPDEKPVTRVDLRAQICTIAIFAIPKFLRRPMEMRLAQLQTLRVRLDHRGLPTDFENFMNAVPSLEVLSLIVEELIELGDDDGGDYEIWMLPDEGEGDPSVFKFVKMLSKLRLPKLRDFTLKIECPGTCDTRDILDFLSAHNTSLRRLKLQKLDVTWPFIGVLHAAQSMQLERLWWYKVSDTSRVTGIYHVPVLFRDRYNYIQLCRGGVVEGDVVEKLKTMFDYAERMDMRWEDQLERFPIAR